MSGRTGPSALSGSLWIVILWRQAKMRPTFARAREPSRIVDGDLEAMQIVDAEIQVRT